MRPNHKTVAEVARDLNVSPQTVHRWRSGGVSGIKLLAWRKGGRWMIDDADLESFLRAVTAAKTPAGGGTTSLRGGEGTSQALIRDGW